MQLTKWQIAITVLLAAGAVLSVLRYSRGRLPPSKKIILAALRAGWIIGLLLSLLEPTIRFERFESGKMKIPVLIDASVSMQNFSPDTYVKPFLDTLSSLQSRTGGRVGFEYFLFGDSARVRQPSIPLLFTDSKSAFPNALDETDGRLSSDMIIISDGHWTGSRKTSEIFPRNTIYYLALPEASPNPFVTVSHDAPETSPSDSAFTVDISASGYAEEDGVLTVLLKEGNRVIRTESAKIERGYFSRAFRIRTSNATPGKRLYNIEAVIGGAVPPSASSFVHQTIPHFLTYSMYSARPTLDRRYVTQALMSNNFFREKVSSPDILFLFDWDSTAAKMMRALPRHAAVVFAGCLPCSSSSIAAPSIAVKPVDNNNALINNLDLRSVPPPQEIITCNKLPLSGTKRLLAATVNTAGGRPQAAGQNVNQTNRPENLNILFTGRFMGKQSLFFPIKGIWRWDFWPMSSDRAESELFGFSNALLSMAKELLFDNISDRLILYPAGDITETDSARFHISFPAAVPIFEPVKLSLQIKNENINIDTALNYTPSGLNKQPLSLPALPPSRYAVSAALNYGGFHTAFIDSFTVNKDMSELSVLAQNKQYLQEFAQPLDLGDYDVIGDIFNSWYQRSAEKHTVTETVRFHRSWLLLGAVLLILAAELILRRMWGED